MKSPLHFQNLAEAAAMDSAQLARLIACLQERIRELQELQKAKTRQKQTTPPGFWRN